MVFLGVLTASDNFFKKIRRKMETRRGGGRVVRSLVRFRSETIPIYDRFSSAHATLRAAGVALGRAQLRRTMACMALMIDRGMKLFF